jgi:hypothetical protein
MHGSTMYERHFDDMSVGELWMLYEQVESILARRLIAKKQELEARLERLRPKDPLGSSQEESVSGNPSDSSQKENVSENVKKPI